MNLFKKNLLVLFIALLISFFFLEVISKIIRKNRISSNLIVPHHILHHTWKKNLQSAHKNPEYEIITNSNGWLETYEIKKNKKKNIYRIFCVGDSNTEGRVNNEYKTCSLLEKKLNNKFSSLNINFEIINTGTSSYSTIIYYLLIKNYLIEYQPDMILLNIDMTDVPNDNFYRNFVVKNSEDEILAVTPQDNTKNIKYQLTPKGYKELKINKFYNAILKKSDFFYFFDRAISRLKWWGKLNIRKDIDKTYNKADWLNLNWDEEIKKNVYESTNMIKKIINLSKKNNIDLVITGVPHLQQFTGEQSIVPHEILKNIANKNDVYYFDLFKNLKNNYKKTELSNLYWEGDPTHFNKSGNKIWADLFFVYLKSSGIFNILNTKDSNSSKKDCELVEEYIPVVKDNIQGIVGTNVEIGGVELRPNGCAWNPEKGWHRP